VQPTLSLQMTPLQFVRFVALGCLITEMSVDILSANEPMASARLIEGQATTFTASGVIDRFHLQNACLTFFSDAPFWGPPRRGSGLVYLWPKNTLFVLFIPGPTTITLDGKKISITQLAVGQRVQVQYNMAYNGTYCDAYRIDARSPSPPSHSDPSRKAKSRP
jgi:hypothetical protein